MAACRREISHRAVEERDEMAEKWEKEGNER